MEQKLLIVDDEAHIRMLIEQTLEDLEDEGVELLFAENGEQALEIIKRDDVIDRLDDKITQELLTYISSDQDNTRNVISLMFITRSIERIADYATNVAEMIYFMVTGEIIKHRSPDKVVDG